MHVNDQIFRIITVLSNKFVKGIKKHMLRGLRQLDVREQDEAVVKNRLSHVFYIFF